MCLKSTFLHFLGLLLLLFLYIHGRLGQEIDIFFSGKEMNGHRRQILLAFLLILPIGFAFARRDDTKANLGTKTPD